MSIRKRLIIWAFALLVYTLGCYAAWRYGAATAYPQRLPATTHLKIRAMHERDHL